MVYWTSSVLSGQTKRVEMSNKEWVLGQRISTFTRNLMYELIQEPPAGRATESHVYRSTPMDADLGDVMNCLGSPPS